MKWLMAGCAVLAAAMSWAYVEVDDDVVVDYQDPKTKLGFDVSGNEATIMWAPITLSGSYTIPSTLTGDGRDFKVTAIGSEAFYDCTRITALTIPEGVRTIDAEAFVNCKAMTSVTLPSTLERIDRCAFEDCVKLATLVIPCATTSIHDEAFDCCDVLRITVEAGNPAYKSVDGALLTADGRKLIFATGGQTEYSVPESVTELGDFSLGYTVETVHFKGGVPSYSEWGQAFEPANIKQITYTLAHKDEWEQVAGNGKWTVAYNAGGTSKQRSISALRYGQWTVQGTNAQYLIVENGIVVGLSNKNIRGELVIPEEIDEPITGIADIFGSGDGPFAYCPYLTKVVIPGTVKSVATGTTTFLHCNSLKEVVLEEGVETMNFVWAFWECPQLSKITLPSTFKGSNISSGRLEGSENFARQVVYDIAPENPYFKVEGNFVVNKAGHPCNRPEGTVLLRYQGPIGASARVVVPEQVTHIADGACRYPAFGTLVMHAGVTELGAFEGSVYSDEDWGDDGLAVGGASGFEVDAANPVYGSMSGSLVRKADGETVLIRPYQAHTMTTCKVPEGVTILGNRAFALCETMRTVTLPSTLRVIGDTPFYNCTSLTEITIPKSVERMGDLLYDTYMPHAISKITFQGPPPEYDGHGWASPSGNISVTGYYPQSRAWRWKTAMAEDNDHNDTKWYGLPMASYQDITGPAKDLTYDENGVITGVSNKATSGALVIPDEGENGPITGIAQDAFTDCTRITSVTVPGTIRTIGNRRFVRMTGLKEIIFQEGVESIAWGAFSDCTALSRVVIPASCTSIDDAAFDTCGKILFEVAPSNPVFQSRDGALLSKDGTRLYFAPGNVTTYTIPDTVVEVGKYAFGTDQPLSEIIVPKSVVSLPATCCWYNTNVRKLTFKGNPPEGGVPSGMWVDGNPWPSTVTGYYPLSRQTAWETALATDNDGDDATWYGLKMAAYADVTGPAKDLIYEGGTVSGMSSTTVAGALEIPDLWDGQTIDSIAQDAFTGCTRITSVTVPGTISTIGYRNFVGMTGLKEVILQAGVQTIKAGAFSGCTALTRVVIPASVMSIEPFAFANCPDIAFEVAEGNEAYSSVGGALFSKDGTRLIVAPGNVRAYTIPETVQSIAAGAFAANQGAGTYKLASVTIPASVGKVEEGAFAGFGSVVVDAANEAYLSTADGALFDKVKVRLLHVPNTVTTYTVPEGVEAIGPYAFTGCSNLTTLTLPTSIREISHAYMGDYLPDATHYPTFEGCSALKSIIFPGKPEGIISYITEWPAAAVGYYPAFWTGLWSVVLDEAGKWNGLPMAAKAPSGNAGLLKYDPESLEPVVTAVSGAIRGALEIPQGVAAIKPGALNGAGVYLSSVTVPGSVKTIQGGTFDTLTGLAIVTLQDGVTSIEADAFSGCTKLTKVVIPASCMAIDSLAFANCPDIAFEVSPDNPVYQSVGGALLSKDGMRLIAAPGNVRAYSIPETVTVIGAGAFAANQGAGIYKLASVTLPASVRTIEEGAFAGFGKVLVDAANEAYASTADGALFDKAKVHLLHVPNTVATYVVPDGVESVEKGAFKGCAALTGVTLPYSLGFVDAEAFANCPKLAQVTFMGEPPSLYAEDVFGTCKAGAYPALLTGKWSRVLDESGLWAGMKMTAYTSSGVAGGLVYDPNSEDPVITGFNVSASGALVIPSGVVAINPGAFDGAARLTAVTVPGSVATIQGGTFRNLTGLTTVTLQEGVESIEAEAFEGCTKLTKVVIPASCTSIAEGALGTCGNVIFEVAPGNPAYKTDAAGALLTIDGTMLVAAPGVAGYDVPNGVARIADYAFAGRPALTRVSLPVSLQEVPDFAFIESAATLSMREENGRFYTIDGALFMHDASGDGVTWEHLLHVPTSVTIFVIPDGVTVIDNYAFTGCAKLTQVTLPAVQGENDVTIGEHTFEGCTALKTVIFRGKPDLLFSVFSAWPATAVGYYPALWTAAWEAVLDAEGKWNGLTMRAQVASGASGALVYGGTSDNPTVTDIATTASGVLEVPYGVTGIEPGALDGAARLTAITIPGSVETIQGGTFKNLAGLTTVTLQEGVKTIEADAFSGCAKLTKVVIPASCTAIAPAAFTGCTGITFEVAADNTALASKDGALLSKDGTVLHLAPGNVAAYTIPAGVTTVAEGAFQNNLALTTVIVPAGVTTIEAHAFAACIRLTKVDFRGLPPTIIGAEAFGTCKAGAYIATYWREWDEVSDEAGVWNGLTMTTTPLTLTINRIGSGNVRDGTTTISRFPATRSYQPGRTITLTAVPASKNVLLGWSGDGSFETDGMTVTFSSENMTEITVHFVSQTVANSIEAVGMGPGGEDSSLEDALASGEVVRKEDIPDLVKEMAFGAPVIEVQDGSVRVGIDIQTAETLGDWKLLDLQNVEVQADAQERLMLIFKKPADSTAQFYKFVLPEEPSSKVKR